jgi:hypothetical protein
MGDCQYVHVKRGKKCLHIVTELGIVNIFLDLRDIKGRLVENIQIIPDDNFMRGRKVKRIGSRLVQLKGVIKHG